MDINTYNAIGQTSVTTTTKKTGEKTGEKTDNVNTATTSETSKSGFSDVAATYEAAKKPDGDNAVNKATDRAALIQMMKNDQEKLKNNLFSIVQKSLTGQVGTLSIANNDSDMWKIIASGKFTASAEDIARAKESKKRAEERIKSKDPNVDVKRARLALARALARLKAAEEK